MPGKRLPAEIRFENFVDKTNDHWFWKGYHLPNGFARFSHKSKTVYAHHYAWSQKHGRWPRKNERIIHLCGERSCVNPDHLQRVAKS